MISLILFCCVADFSWESTKDAAASTSIPLVCHFDRRTETTESPAAEAGKLENRRRISAEALVFFMLRERRDSLSTGRTARADAGVYFSSDCAVLLSSGPLSTTSSGPCVQA